MADKEYGIKETREAVLAIFAVVRLVYSIAKDGITTGDAWTLLSAFMDYNFRTVLNSGIQGANLIKYEVTNLSAEERSELWALVNQEFAKIQKQFSLGAEDLLKLTEYVHGMFGQFKNSPEDPLG